MKLPVPIFYLLLGSMIILPNAKATSQQTLATFDVDGQVQDLQGFAVGDSLFVTYRVRQAATSQIHAMWIDASGNITKIPFGYGDDSRLCAITKSNKNILFHYLTNSVGNLVLQTEIRGAGPNLHHPIKGTILSISEQQTKLVIVTFNKTDNRLTVAKLSNGVAEETKSFDVPAKLQKFINESGGAMSVDHQLSPIAMGAGRLKVYFNENDPVITLDEHLVKNAGTTVLKFDWATGTVKTHMTRGVNFRRFTSFYHNDNLYRYTMHRDSLDLTVTHWESEALISRAVFHEHESLKKYPVYVRDGAKHNVGKNNLYNFIRYGTELAFDPSLLVQTIPGTNDVRVVIGKYYNEKGAGSFGGFPNPFAVLATFMVTHAIKQLGDGPGLANYFTLKGNTEKGFVIESIPEGESRPVRQIIDDYETERTNPEQSVENRWELYLKQKQYVSLPYGAIGLYEEKVKRDRRLIILKYVER